MGLSLSLGQCKVDFLPPEWSSAMQRDSAMQQYIVIAIVVAAAVYLLRSVVGWAQRGGRPYSCPGCGSCGKPKKQPNALLSMIGLGKK